MFVWASVCVCERVCMCVRLHVRVCLQVSVYLCVCVRSSLQIQYFLILFYFHDCSPVSYHYLCSICHRFLRHNHFSSPRCGICYDIHFYTNHLLFFFLPFFFFQTKNKSCIPDSNGRSVDRLRELYIESPFII